MFNLNYKEFLRKDGNVNTQKMKKQNFGCLIDYHTYSEIAYFLKNGFVCPLCKCGNKVSFLGFKDGYSTFCCSSCKFAKEQQKLKREKTNIERFGYKNPFQNGEIKEKSKKTRLEKYGAEYSSQRDSKTREVIHDKFKSKYGGISPFVSKEIQQKSREKMKERYGVENSRYIHFKNFEDFNKEFIEREFLKDGFLQRKEICDYFGMNYWHIPILLKNLEITIPLSRDKTKTQKEIYDFIKEHYDGVVLFNDNETIKPKELDIFVPELKFAIEFDGVYWHSTDTMKDSYINLEKVELCEELNIHLFRILDLEWMDEVKRDIWKSKILYKLNLIKNKISARSCTLKEISLKEAKQFLEENHLQGYAGCSHRFGLFHKGELVSVMTFGKSRFKKGEIELIRFASKKYTIVRGAFNKMLKFFVKNFKRNIVSYGNRRWTYKENVYKGFFTNIETTQPNHFYYKGGQLHSRIKFQKHKLKEYFEIGKLKYFNPEESGVENMIKNGYLLYFDCGNYKFSF